MFVAALQRQLAKLAPSVRRPRKASLQLHARPRLEQLEDRCVPSYSAVDLGATVTPTAINNSGVVVSYLNTSPQQAVEEQNGVITVLGTLGGATSHATGINDAGQVVGYADTASGTYHATLWQNGTVIDLGTLGGPNSEATGINNLGQIVGWADVTATANTFHAVEWPTTGGIIDLGTFGGSYAWASAINASGQIVGNAVTGSSIITAEHAFFWDPTSGGQLLGQLGGDSASQATGINDAGQVVGTSGSIYQPLGATYHPPYYRANQVYLWQKGAMTGLGFYAASASINNNGQVVGGADLWQSGSLINLNGLLDPSLGWTINSTAGINNAGQIVGQFMINGQTDGYVIGPTDLSQAISLAVSGFPAATTAGVPGSFTVTARNGVNAPASGYTGTVNFKSSDAQAGLPSAYTFTAADGGVHTFSATLKTAGTQSVTATDSANAGLAGSQAGIVVNPATASKLLISGPASVKSGTAFSVTVTALDAYGNVATGYAGTVSFKSSDSTATLPKNYTFTTTDKGVHTFTGLILKKKGTQTITGNDTLNSAITGTLSVSVM